MLTVAMSAGCSSSADSAESGADDADVSSSAEQSTGPPTPPGPAATVEGLLALDRPVVLAHGAGEDDYPPETLYGFSRSAEDGVDVLDFNVWHTSDDVVVVIHDGDVARTTNGSGAVTEMTAAELGALDAAWWFTEDCTCDDRPDAAYVWRGVRDGDRPAPVGASPDDFGVPTLGQVLDRFEGWVLNIEVKGEGDEALRTAELTVNELREAGRLDSAIVTSFDDEVVAHLAELAPDLELTPGLDASARYVLSDEPPPAGQRILQLPVAYEGIELLSDDFLARAHAAGLMVWVWPNDAAYENVEEYRRFFDRGLDGVNANRPSEAVAARNGFVDGSQ